MTDAPTFPCPVPPKPPIARQHCRHYDYVNQGMSKESGPRCAVGCDNDGIGGALACMPPEFQRGAICSKREEWSDSERAEWERWQDHHMRRLVVVMQAIPKSASGSIPCPACGLGAVSFSRARSNSHLWAACSTPNCFSVIQ